MDDGYGLVAIKRDWVPEWFWYIFGHKLRLALIQPFRWILTRKPCKWQKVLERGGPKGQPITKRKREAVQVKLKEHVFRMHAEAVGP